MRTTPAAIGMTPRGPGRHHSIGALPGAREGGVALSASGGPLATWTAAALTLAVFSYLYRDNALWRAVEHLYVGLAAGYGLGYGWHNYLHPVIVGDMIGRHQWWYLAPLLLGLLVFARNLPGGAVLARLPLALWVGYGAGYALAYLPRTLWLQVRGSFLPPDRWGNALVLATLVGGLCYFLFTLGGTRGVLGTLGRWGRWAVLGALGASFGGAVLYRYTIFLGRVAFLLKAWLGL